jgi:hypothetical protein
MEWSVLLRPPMIRPAHLFSLFAAALLSGCSGSGGSEPWSKRFGDSANQGNVIIGVDGSGATALTGSFAGSIDFGGGPLVGTGIADDDFFIARFDGSSAHLWSGGSGNEGLQAGRGVVIDPQGDTISTGLFSGSINFGTGKIAALSSDIFVARFDGEGKATWVGHFSGDNGGPVGVGTSDPTGGIAVDRDGNLAIAGWFTGTLGFGGPPLDTLPASANTFVAKLDPKGQHVFSMSFGGGGHQANGVAFDPDGNVIVAGLNFSVIELGGASFTTTGQNGFAAKLGPDGEPRWLQQFGGDGTSEARAVAVDGDGNVFVGGSFSGTFEVGTQTVNAFSQRRGFVVKLSPSGQPQWLKTFDGAEVVAVTTTANGDVFFTGGYNGTPDFGGGRLPFRSLTGAFLAGLTTDGGRRYSKAFVTDGDVSTGTSLAAIGDDVMMAGAFDGFIDFGADKLRSSGQTDIFVARVSP